MSFDIEELKTPEAKAYMELVYLKDDIGLIQDLGRILSVHPPAHSLKRKVNTPVPKASRSKPLPPQSKIIAVEELSDSEDDEGLTPYQKPDEDPEDSDDDPTLINRAKPVPPV